MKKSQSSELIHADENGNAIIGKNIEVGGTTKLNGGFEPVETLSFKTNHGTYTFNIYTQIILSESTDQSEFVNFFGKLDNESERLSVLVTGSYYRGDQENIIDLNAIYLDEGEISIILHIYLDGGLYKSEISNILTTSSNLKSQLYRHVITLHANSTSDGSCRLEYISPYNLVCDSLQDLRTVLGNPQMNSYVASNPSGDLFGVVISPSTAQFKKVGTTSLVNITSVDDTVTPL